MHARQPCVCPRTGPRPWEMCLSPAFLQVRKLIFRDACETPPAPHSCAPPALPLLGHIGSLSPGLKSFQAEESLARLFYWNSKPEALSFHFVTHNPSEVQSLGKKHLKDCVLGQPHFWHENKPCKHSVTLVFWLQTQGDVRFLRNPKPQL